MDELHLLPDWAKSFFEQDKKDALAEHRISFLTQISLLAREGHWQEMDNVISTAPLPEQSGTALMVVLRGTFRFKDRLPSWTSVRDRVQAEFDERKANTSSLMIGL